MTSKNAMPTKCSVYIATSLDGFIARPNGGIDWLDSPGDPAGEDYGYKEFFSSIDALVMGRNTYELVLTFGEWPYEKKVIVLSSGMPTIPEKLTGKVEIMAGTPQEIVARLAEQGANHLYIDGGKTIQGFLQAGLIDEMIITRIPVLIGEGIPLFGKLEQDVRWQHIETKAYSNGLVMSKYRVLGAAIKQ
jgi:dihydrofolate reductase